VLSTGEWLLPYCLEPHPKKLDDDISVEANDIRYSGVLISRDNGTTWKASAHVKENHSMWEPTTVEYPNNDVVMFMRSKNGYIYQVISKDKGETWSKPEKSVFPNPSSKTHLFRYSKDTVMFFYNHSSKGFIYLSL
jgi:predicted neuraminidase